MVRGRSARSGVFRLFWLSPGEIYTLLHVHASIQLPDSTVSICVATIAVAPGNEPFRRQPAPGNCLRRSRFMSLVPRAPGDRARIAFNEPTGGVASRRIVALVTQYKARRNGRCARHYA